MDDKIQTLVGGISCDDRGYVSFVNDFNPSACNIQRFYNVTNHRQGFVRAWHGHLHEAKYVYVVNGSIKIAAVKFESAKDDGLENRPVEFVLSSAIPKVLYIPPGYANGFQTLEPNTNVMFFSTSSLEQSAGDDIRFPWNHWSYWKTGNWENEYR